MKLTLTERIGATLKEWEHENGPCGSSKVGNGWIDHEFLYEVSEYLKRPLIELVRGTSVYIPAPAPKPAKSPEYIKLMEKLQLQAQENEYRELAGLKDEEGPMFGGSDAKQVKEEITTILNFAVSVFAVGFSLWYWAKWWDPASRTLLAILGSLVVLVAEVVVYASYRSKVEEARHAERTTKHISTIAEPVVLLGGGDHSCMTLPQPLELKPSQGPGSTQNNKGTGSRKKKQKKNTAITTGSTQPTTLRPRVPAH